MSKDNIRRCRDCKHAHLIQYGNNPVLAECTLKPQHGNERFPYAIDVASSPRYCNLFTQRTGAEEIEHRQVRYWTYMKGETAA